jgi:protein SCO1/2
MIARWVISVLLMAVASATPADGGPGDGVSLQQHLGASLPLQRQFRDEEGSQVRLGEYFSTQPVVLLFAYYDCPNLCETVLNGAFQAVLKTGLTAGRDYGLIVVGIAPEETPTQARASKDRLLSRYHLGGGGRDVHFLTGQQPDIAAVTDAAGFRYYYDEQLQQYAHAAGLLVVAPDGRLSRYFYGVRFDAEDLRLALLEAADDRIGSAVHQLLLLCFHYDPESGKYSLRIVNALRLAGGLSVLLLAAFVWRALRRERRSRGRA